MLGATLGKIADGIRVPGHDEVGQFEEAFDDGRHGSSTIPHEGNLAMCEDIVRRARSRARVGHAPQMVCRGWRSTRLRLDRKVSERYGVDTPRRHAKPCAARWPAADPRAQRSGMPDKVLMAPFLPVLNRRQARGNLHHFLAAMQHRKGGNTPSRGLVHLW